MTCINQYPINELIVLQLCTTNDSNGHSRQIFALVHPLHGYLAALKNEYGAGELSNFDVTFQDDSLEISTELRRRILRIDITPGEYKRILSKEYQATMKEWHAILTL